MNNIIIQSMPKISITIVPKEIGQLWDQILENSLNDICKEPAKVPQRPLTELIKHKYSSKYNLHLGQSYQQHTGNLCGYHSTFNTLCFLNLLRGEYMHYDILSGASFWSFKRKMERFLMDIKQHNKLKDQWPWKQSDILYGDFERTYNKLCLDYFQEFQVFRDHGHFQLLSFTWQFQYQNLLLSQDKKRELNQYITYFKNYKQEKPLVINFMLAITNHWMCFIAVKSKNATQYWFFDSSNRDFIDLTHTQIDQYVERLDRERKELGKEAFSQFFKTNMGVCMKDTQISLKLIIDCLEGKTTIEEYAYNQQFNIFANQIQKFWEIDHNMAQKAIREYWYNISSFFRAPLQHNLLNSPNKERLEKLIRLSHSLRSTQQGGKLNNLVKKYSNQTHI